MSGHEHEPVSGVVADLYRLLDFWLRDPSKHEPACPVVGEDHVLAAAAGMAVLLDALRQDGVLDARTYGHWAQEERFIELNRRLITNPSVSEILCQAMGFLDPYDIKTRFAGRSLTDLRTIEPNHGEQARIEGTAPLPLESRKQVAS